MKRDFYEVLGLKKGADSKEIKRAYHRLAKKYHPDTNQGDASAEQKFKEVSEAYEMLSDPEKKKMYDAYGMAAFDEQTAGAYQNAGTGRGFGGQRFYQNGPYQEYHYSSSDMGGMDDILKNMFGGSFGGFSGSRAGFGNQTGGKSSDWFFHDFTGSNEPRDSRSELQVSLRDAAFGCDRQIRPGGSSSDLRVHIPAGIADGQSLRLKGKGNGGADLLLTIRITPDPTYERKGNDLYTTAQIPYSTAVLGGKAAVHTLYGNVECSIPAGTQSGSKIRLKGKGIVSMKNKKEYGDEYVTIQIQVPKSVSAEEKELLRKLAVLRR